MSNRKVRYSQHQVIQAVVTDLLESDVYEGERIREVRVVKKPFWKPNREFELEIIVENVEFE